MDRTLSRKDEPRLCGYQHYADDENLSLSAKGVLTMMVNLPFERFWPLTDDPEFPAALEELQVHGYVAGFGFDGWDICPALPLFTFGVGRHGA